MNNQAKTRESRNVEIEAFARRGLCQCGIPHGGVSRPGRGLRKQWLRLFSFIKAFHKEAAAQGIGREALSALDSITYDPGIVAEDRAQNIFSQSFLEFQARMITDYRIKHGAELVQETQGNLCPRRERIWRSSPGDCCLLGS